MFVSIMSDTDELSEFEQEFNEAAKFLESIVGDLDQSILLEFYGLYKQATIGKCDTAKPGIFALQAKAKWNSWNGLGDMTKEHAMIAYVDKLTDIKPEWQLKVDPKQKKAQWVSVSQPQINEDDADPEDMAEADKTCLDFVKEGNTEKLLQMLDAVASDMTKPHLNCQDDSGLALIHWAADRGNVSVLEVLLLHGVDVNAVDSEGQTALHYAASVGHIDSVKTLLKFGADRAIKDSEGQTCVDVAESIDIANVLKNSDFA